ncbi:hypothetical protein [Vampirovibrio sp.]|uniref:hypothetical protein n=1 Tax=Vampirovibrio sp. TaxID=2717857 RepID=UPI0035941B6D
MTGGAAYILKGHGSIHPAWVRDCFCLFRDRAVNIRKLVLLSNGQAACYAMLEIHFVLSPDELAKADPALFLADLQTVMNAQQWQDQSLTAV